MINAKKSMKFILYMISFTNFSYFLIAFFLIPNSKKNLFSCQKKDLSLFDPRDQEGGEFGK